MKTVKRALSLFLSVAMVVTGVNLGTLSKVQAAEIKNETYYREVTGTFYGTEGNQVSLGTSTELSAEGSAACAASIKGTTYDGGNTSNWGSARYGCLVFQIPTDMDLTNLQSASVTLKIKRVANLSTNGWMKVALYETNNPQITSGSPESNYSVKNGYHGVDSAFWSEEKISDRDDANNLLSIHFNVKDAVQNVDMENGRLVLRVQVPRAGIGFNDNTPATLMIDATTPTNASVEYVDEQGNKIQNDKILDVSVGSRYTYDILNEEKTLTKDGQEYKYQADASKTEISNVMVSGDDGSAANNKITLVYKKVELTSVEAPSTIYVIEGNDPILPKQVTANTNIADYTKKVDVAWNADGEKWTVGEHSIAGTAAGLDGDKAKVSVKVQVYECDEAINETIVAAHTDNGKDGLHMLSKQYKGEIISEFDITTTGTVSDGAFVYPTKVLTNNNDIWVNGGPMLHFKKSQGFFNVRSGDGNGGAGNDPANDGKAIYDGKNVYHVRMEMDSSTHPGVYRAYVTDPDGNVNEVGTNPNGNGFRKYEKGVIESYYVGRGGFTVSNHKIYWKSGYAAVYADFCAPDGTKLAGARMLYKELPDSSRAIDAVTAAAIFTPKAKDGKIYLYNPDNSGWDVDGNGKYETGGEDIAATESATMPGANEEIHFIGNYEEAQFKGQAEAVKLEAVLGKMPVLPNTVKATYEDVEGAIETEVTWNITEEDVATETPDGQPRTVTGTFVNGETVTATLEVKHAYLLAHYAFDGENPAKDSTGRHEDAVLENVTEGVDGVENGSTAVTLKGGNNGTSYVKLPDDLLQVPGPNRTDRVTQDDITISMFINREVNGNSFALTLHATEVGKSNPAGHMGLINKDTKEVSGGNYGAPYLNFEYRKGGATTGQLKPAGDPVTPSKQWVHFAIVTNGSEGAAKLYQDGVLVAENEGTIVKPSELPAQNNYLGRASWPDNDYKATYDDFRVYNGILTEEEIQEIANEKLCKAPVDDIYDSLALTLASGEGIFNKDEITEDLNLPTEMETSDGKNIQGLKIAWESDNTAIRTNGKVVRPSKKHGNATVNLKATIQYGSYTRSKTFANLTVLALDGASFVEFDEAYAQAEERYESAKAENIYTDASLAAMKAKLEEADAVKATEGKPEEDSDVVDAMAEQLKTIADVLVLKSFEEINKSLAAWYPLDDGDAKAKDFSGKGCHGTAADSVTFSRESGATFNGGKGLQNCIKLPAESLERLNVTDNMTFSFWAKDERGTKSNAFGIGSGDAFGSNGCVSGNNKDAQFFYVNTCDNNELYSSVNTKYWSSPSTIKTTAPAKDEWHHITSVISGKTLTLYVDGIKQGETIATQATLTEIWNQDPETRGMYIGNCSYGTQPAAKADADYKGSIRDVRVYNASLAPAQIEAAYRYKDEVLPMKYAKDDLIRTLGARVEEDGTVILNVTNLSTTNGVLTLPKTSYGDAKVTWNSSDDNVINAATGAAAIPAKGEPHKKATLTATISIGEGEGAETSQIVFNCNVYFKNDTDTTALQQALQAIEDENLVEEEYTAASWNVLKEAKKKAQEQIDDPGDDAQVAAVKDELEAARQGLKRRGDMELLQNAVAEAEKITAQADYTPASWGIFDTALTEAKDKLEADLSVEEVTELVNALQTAMNSLTPTQEQTVGEKEKADMAAAIAEINALRKTYYTSESWTALQEKVTALKALQNKANATKNEVEAAIDALEDARNKLVPTGNQKPDPDKIAELNTAFEAATTANEGMKETDYTAESWETYQNAYAAMKKIADRLADDAKKGSVTKSEIDTAIANLKTATEGLVRNVDKTALTAAIAGCASLRATDYNAATWSVFQTALNAAKAVAAKGDATQAEVNAALANLNAKKAGLKRNVLVSSIKLSATYKNVAAGKKTTVKATVNSNATNKGVTFTSSNAKWAAVNAKTGVVTTKKAGAGKTVTITATANDAGKKKQTIKIKIMKGSVTKITVKKKSLKVKAGKKVTIKATVKTKGKPANKTLSFKSSNTKWATVNSKGKVTTKKAGKGKTVKITITSTDGTNKKAVVKIKLTK